MTIGKKKMPRASALAPQAVSVVGSLFINRVHKVDNSTKDVKELFLVELLWQTATGHLHPPAPPASSCRTSCLGCYLGSFIAPAMCRVS